jgi:hypothetical protein
LRPWQKKTAPRLTAAELKRYFALDAQRLSLQRQAKALVALQEKIEERMIAVVEADGGRERTVLTCGYVLALQDAPGTVKWKDEFVRVAGSDEAERLVEAAPKKEKLTVQPAG